MNPYLDCSKPNFWLSCLTIDKGVERSPMDLMQKLSDANIETRPIWKPMHMQPVFKNNDFIKVKEKSVGEDIFSRGLCLPSDIKMTQTQQDFVIEQIRKFFD